MEPVNYLRAFRQWWWVIVLAPIVGVALAVFVVPSPATTYSARYTLLSGSGNAGPGVPTLAQMAIVVGAGDVPQRVAATLGGSPASVTAGLSAYVDDPSQVLIVEVNGDDGEEVALRAKTFADALVASVNEAGLTQYESDLTQARARLTTMQAQGASFDQLNEQRSVIAEIEATGPPSAGLRPVADEASVRSVLPTGKAKRTAIAAGVGLALGLGLALVLSRFDTRVHTRPQAEAAFGIGVIGEIPFMSRSAMKRGVTVAADGESVAAEAYRGLRSALMLKSMSYWEQGAATGRSRASRRSTLVSTPPSGTERARVILVTSPGISEGKTTCVANLAAAFAESGNRVLVLSCDLRRPTIERVLLAEGEKPGAVDVLEQSSSVSDALHRTSIDNVGIVPSGGPIHRPGGLFAYVDLLVEPARELADIVLIDTPPVLATDDVSALIPLVDDVLLVCRVGSTKTDAAATTCERLKQFGAPIAGVVLIGGQATRTMRGYYRSDTPRSRANEGRGRSGASNGNGTTGSVGAAVHEVNVSSNGGGARSMEAQVGGTQWRDLRPES